MGCLSCLCARMPAWSAPSEKDEPGPHKFAAKADWSYAHIYTFAFVEHWIPLMKHMSVAVGRERFLALLRSAAAERGRQDGLDWAKNVAQADLGTFKKWIDDPFSQRIKTVYIVADSPKAFEVKVTECLWAKTFREADAADLGYAGFCHRSESTAPAYNAHMTMIRTKTLMQGNDYCNPRWIWSV